MSQEPVPSFEDLSEELSRPLFDYLRRMVGNAADAEDLLQETLIRIAKGLPLFEHRSSVRTWAFRIATNTAIDFLRKTKNSVPYDFSETGDISQFDEEDRLVLDEMNECIRDVIHSLPPDYRAALVLYNLEGQSVEETARICNASVSNVKMRIHRAKELLREAMNRTCDFYKSAGGDLRCDRKDPRRNG